MLIKENNNSCNYNVKHHKFFDDLVYLNLKTLIIVRFNNVTIYGLFLIIKFIAIKT